MMAPDHISAAEREVRGAYRLGGIGTGLIGLIAVVVSAVFDGGSWGIPAGALVGCLLIDGWELRKLRRPRVRVNA